MKHNRWYRVIAALGVSVLLLGVAVAGNTVVQQNARNGTDARAERVRTPEARPVSESEIDAPTDPLRGPNIAPGFRTEGATTVGAASNYQIDWQSINGGGGPASSANYAVDGSIGQSAIGYATSVSYQAGIGYWYGAGGGGCNCPSQGDVAPLAGPGDGIVNVLDVVALIDEVFRSGPTTTQDGTCPRPRGDLAPAVSGTQCGDGVKNVLDVVAAIDHVFRSGPAPCDPCNP